MNILIIEDEPSNERHLRRLLETVLPDTGTVVSADSVRSSVDLLSGRDFRPDLVFADIQLSDGLCFDIFDRIDEPFPVIFTTAYDSYALKAFEYNALSYLQKPVTEHDLRAALSRISRLVLPSEIKDMRRQIRDMASGQAVYLRRILLECGEETVPADVSDICFLEADFRSVAVYLADGRHGTVDHPLIYFEGVLDPGHFIRVSRRHIIAPSRVRCFRKPGHGKCEAVFPDPVGRVVEFPSEKFIAIRRSFETGI